MRADVENAPGAGQQTGGGGEHVEDNPDIIGDSIAPDGTGADQKDLLPDADAAVDFLEAWRSGGPWVLTAIEVDPPKGRDGKSQQPRIPTATLTKADEVRRWVDDHSGGRWNLYFTVNVTGAPVGKKPEKSDMAAATGFHVDVDPRPGEDFDSERARAEKVLREYSPAATVIIDSGGGFQGFWRLGEELDLPGEPGDEARHLPVEERNLKIETTLQGDSCHNIDRIMRLPGTINWPGEKKRKKGRKPALARVVSADWSRTYTLADFEPSQMVATGGASGAARVNLSADLPTVEGLESLPAAVSDRTKMLITNGDDPDNPTKYPSRSEVLFAVLCELVRAEVADDLIAAVILDPDHGISAHVLEQPNPRRYAQRQIQRAHDQAIDPALRELNDQFTVLENEGGKCRILEFVEMPTGVKGKTRSVVTLQSFEDFRNRFLNRSVVVGRDKDGNDVKMALGKWWLQNAARRQFHSLTFRPRDGEEVGTGATRQLNLWQGFTVRPAPGDWSLMRAHIRDVLASGDEASDSYIIRWMAWTLQNPDEPAEVALTFRGEPGTGKGVFGRTMAQLFGQHGLHTGGSEMITGRFNKHFRDCCLLFADEVVWDGDMDEDRFDAVARRVSDGTPGGPAYRVGKRGLKIVEELAARGVAEATMAKALRMGKDAFRAAKRRDPAVQEAIDRGRATEHDKLVGVLHDLAMAGQYVPAMFLLKARHGYREGEQVGVNVNIDTGGVLVVPNKMTMEEFLEAQRQAGLYDSPQRPDTVERIPGQRTIEAVLDPETKRGD